MRHCERIESILREMEKNIREEVAAGFLSPAEVVEVAVSGLRHDPEIDLLICAAEELAGRAVRAQLAIEQQWPAVTDCDRLDRAFAELERNGILARQHYWSATVGTEMAQRASEGRPVRGYTCYPPQHTAAAVRGEGLSLHFDAAVNSPEPAEAIAREIVATLQRHGLATTWKGTALYCVCVAMDWKRRQPLPARSEAGVTTGARGAPPYSAVIRPGGGT